MNVVVVGIVAAPVTHVLLLIILLHQQLLSSVHASEHAKRLFDDLLADYHRHRRPTTTMPAAAMAPQRTGTVKEGARTAAMVPPPPPIVVRLRLRLSQIIDVHEIDQIMTISVWLRQYWYDSRLAWNPAEYGGLGTLYVPHEMIWVPDLVLYNNADHRYYNVTIGTKATLHHTGKVLWEPPALFKSQCQIDVQWFPFDEQLCQLKFGSWSYPDDLLQLTFWDDPNGTQMEMERGIDLSDYYPSVEWDIMSVCAVRHSRRYPGRSAAPLTVAANANGHEQQQQQHFGDILYILVLRRKPLFYTVNLVFPCVGISFLTILVFYLPSESGEKITLCISILVALTVFFLLLTEVLPATSVVMPLIGKYLLFTMLLVTFSVLITVLSLNLHFRKPSTHPPLPRWLRLLFFHWLPTLLCMRRPLDAQAQLRAMKRKEEENNNNNVHLAALMTTGSGGTAKCMPEQRRKQRNSKQSNKTVAHLQERLHFDFLGPIRVLRDTPLDAICRLPLDERTKRLFRCPETVKAFEHVCFIADLLKRKDRDLKVGQDWKYVANVLDRLFLVLFALCCFLGTAFILLQAPVFYDGRSPLDLMQFQQQNDGGGSD